MSSSPLFPHSTEAVAGGHCPAGSGGGNCCARGITSNISHLPARSLLNRCTGVRMPFTWTINPYRGCEFACKYCYARYTHEFMEMRDGTEFEQKIYVKQHAAELAAAGVATG